MGDPTGPERSPRAWTTRPGVQRACGLCGEQFALPWASAKYCSPACRGQADEARRQRKWERERARGRGA